MRTFKRISNRGFTLVELMIVVAIIGILAALAIYGVRKYLLNSKTAEAKEGIGRMAKDAASAYDGDSMAANVLNLTGSTAITHALCRSAGATVPAGSASIAGKKYQSSPAEWNAGAKDTGWQCLKFSMRDPQYYMYGYTQTGNSGASGGAFTAQAWGDLDGDGTTSLFTLAGSIQKGTTGGEVVTIAPNYEATNPEY